MWKSINMLNVVCILSLFFFSSYAQEQSDPVENMKREQAALGPEEKFGNPYGNPQDYKQKPIPNDFGTIPLSAEELSSPPSAVDEKKAAEDVNAPDQSKYLGAWELHSQNSGVSAMHSLLIPKGNKVLMFDSTIWKISNIKYPRGYCRLLNKNTGERDCYSHSVLYDFKTGQLITKEIHTDTWCSSGGLTVDGNVVSTGGYAGGANTARYLETCRGCGWREFPTALADPRWYSTQAELPDGSYIVVGGRASFSYEYIPAEGKSNTKAYYFDFLKQTTDPGVGAENNLYPFVHLSTDGNLFIFANQRSVLLSPITNQVIKEFPVLPGGHRSYPATGMSVLLPIKLHSVNKEAIPAEVLVCGGSAHQDAFVKAEQNIFYTALQDCGRIRITDPKPVWKREMMPSPRTMGDSVILPTGDVLILNGAQRGVSGWNFAREENMKPVLYATKAKKGDRFRELAPTTIPRMYHSSSILLPDGKILVAGSNTNNGYIYNSMYPTELRVEKFSPPYLNAALANMKPEIVVATAPQVLAYNGKHTVQIKLNANKINLRNIRITMYAPAFTTHGIQMNQRLIDLGLDQVQTGAGNVHTINFKAPPSGRIAPPGYYLLFAVYQGVPSEATWVQIK